MQEESYCFKQCKKKVLLVEASSLYQPPSAKSFGKKFHTWVVPGAALALAKAGVGGYSIIQFRTLACIIDTVRVCVCVAVLST